ncbi:transmembrane protein, putative (macronuclear) [Tetrahymena thermophila SB210]|uniref:Transmembrane protein, putative n=1 Tax=Tetrahymena thermophila (strain SB210) TaxID=312017 RepID=W7XF10_TETTS|nr:transmembrane protein, putative [Tetrahymena thermophila SB210]EWS76382.1 transmembrane protein, putative [Tetrahymena thermophila SB210]|eukprot:XP_012651166.1 transmembrane protein, putative [Tetrahymena thermophila SB210]
MVLECCKTCSLLLLVTESGNLCLNICFKEQIQDVIAEHKEEKSLLISVCQTKQIVFNTTSQTKKCCLFGLLVLIMGLNSSYVLNITLEILLHQQKTGQQRVLADKKNVEVNQQNLCFAYLKINNVPQMT